jgi:hypothetical protein
LIERGKVSAESGRLTGDTLAHVIGLALDGSNRRNHLAP